jgi:murein DD-endopeptidase MepM/ murein hydrolase activator NlpD
MTSPISNADAVRFAQSAGFTGDGLLTIVAIAHAESSLVPDARNRNTDGSIDRGILQINDRWHAEVSDAQADNPATAFKAGYQISFRGTNFTPWSTYTSGAYKKYLDQNGQNMTPGVMQLDLPFHNPAGMSTSSLITQGFGASNPAEPFAYKYADASIWYDQSAGTTSGNWHNGIDFGLGQGVPVSAPHDGTVVYAGFGAPGTQPVDARGFGNCIVIRHTVLGLYTLYGHLSAVEVSLNEHVGRGQEIGRVGSTGNSSGPHLHWSTIRMNDLHYVDPERYLQTPLEDPIHLVSFAVTADADGDPVRIFSGPSRQTTALRVVPPNSTLQCDAWTYGEPRMDKQAGSMDARWFRLADGGWVASARVVGYPIGTTPLP